MWLSGYLLVGPVDGVLEDIAEQVIHALLDIAFVFVDEHPIIALLLFGGLGGLNHFSSIFLLPHFPHFLLEAVPYGLRQLAVHHSLEQVSLFFLVLPLGILFFGALG